MLRLANTFGVGHFWSGSGGGKKFQDLLLAGINDEIAKISEEQTMDFAYVYSKDVGSAIDQAMTIKSSKEITSGSTISLLTSSKRTLIASNLSIIINM